jgi:hypothetical protein
VAETSATEVDVLIAQYVMGPFGPHDYTAATFLGQVAVKESNAAANFRSQVAVRAANTSGTIIAELLGFDTGAEANEFATTAAGVNRQFPRGGAATLASENVTVDHYLVVEFGYHAHNTSATSRTGTFKLGDTFTHTDLPEDETTGGNSARPWFRVSHDLPIPVVDAYDTAIRDASPALVGYYRMEETVTPLVDQALTADMETRAGAPTYDQTGPHTGWKAVSVDGVDDSMRAGGASSNNILPLYEGPGTVVVWAKTGDAAQTHGENQWITLASGTVEGGHTFEMRDLGSGRKHDLHYLNAGLTASDIQHDASETDVWRFWAATAGTTAGMRLYMDEAGDVTLAGSDATTDQMGWECWGFGANQVHTVFGQWVVSRIAVYKAELTETDLQAIYDAVAASGDATATPGTVGTVTAAPTATVTASVEKPATTVPVPAGIPQPTVTGGTAVTPATVDASTAVPTPTVTATVELPVTAVDSLTGLPTPTVTAGGAATPAAVDTTGSIPQPSPSATVEQTAVTVPAVAAVPQASVTASVEKPVTAVDAPVVIPTPTVTAGGSATSNPAPVGALGSVPQPSLSASVEQTAVTVPGVAAVTQPSVTGSVEITVTTVNVVAAIPASTVTATVEKDATTVTVTAGIPTPTVTTGGGTTLGYRYETSASTTGLLETSASSSGRITHG